MGIALNGEWRRWGRFGHRLSRHLEQFTGIALNGELGRYGRLGRQSILASCWKSSEIEIKIAHVLSHLCKGKAP